jgi:hypothetical protein
MLSILLTLAEFIDSAFLRMLWVLFIDYLISAGYLLPEQRTLWEQSYINIIGVAGAMIFMGLWMHHSNKKELAGPVDKSAVLEEQRQKMMYVMTGIKRVGSIFMSPKIASTTTGNTVLDEQPQQ